MTPLTFKPLSKRVRILRGDREVGRIIYLANEVGWVAYVDGVRMSRAHSTWPEAAEECKGNDE